jgi:hypothetical protein
MAKLNTGTRIYGTANVDTSVTIGTSTITTGTGALLANVTTLFTGNNTVYASLNTTSLNISTSTSLNTTSLSIGTTIANTIGVYTSGTVSANSHTIGSSFIANTTQLTITTPLSANGSVGTSGYILATGGTNAAYWRDTVRVSSQASAAAVTIDSNAFDMYIFTALGTGLTFNASSLGVNGRKVLIRIKDDGTARAITWTTGTNGFRAIGLSLPTTTTLGKTLYVGLVYNAEDQRWDAIAYTIEA